MWWEHSGVSLTPWPSWPSQPGIPGFLFHVSGGWGFAIPAACPGLLEESLHRKWKQPKNKAIKRIHRDFWEIVVDDRSFGADALFKQVNVQSKTVFSNAMTLMDQIRGWEDEEKRGIQICLVHVDLHQESIDQRTKTESSNGRVLEEANVVHYSLHALGLCRNFQWTRVGTIIQHVEEVMGVELDSVRGISVHVVGFLHLRGWTTSWDLNWNQKVPRRCQQCYHGRYCTTMWRITHTEVVHVDIGGKGPTRLFQLRDNAEGVPVVSMLARKTFQRWKKTTAVLKMAMTEKSVKWKSKEWYGTTKTRWQQPARSSGGRSSDDEVEHAKPKGMWKEVSAEFDAVGAVVKEEKKHVTQKW